MNLLRLPTIVILTAAACTCAVGCVAATPSAATACHTGGAPPADPATDAKLRTVIASPDRPAAEVARDKYRHPRETLEFFGITDTMTVVELWPGAGWYTAILAPLLADKGKLVVTQVDSGSAPRGEAGMGENYKQRLASNPVAFGKIEVREIAPKGDLTFGPDGSADAVVTFRSVHGWIHNGIADKVFAAALRVLKPGGILGVAEHRAKPDADPAKAGDTGYVPEKYVIDLAQKAGFVLDARSEINGNPLDTKDWSKGVWTLPPTLRLGDQDRAKYEAVGESDRMTLRFHKP